MEEGSLTHMIRYFMCADFLQISLTVLISILKATIPAYGKNILKIATLNEGVKNR